MNFSKTNFNKNYKNFNENSSYIHTPENKSYVKSNELTNYSPKKFMKTFNLIKKNKFNINYKVKNETSLFSPFGNNFNLNCENTKEFLVYENNKLN